MNHLDPRPRERNSLADANHVTMKRRNGTGGERATTVIHHLSRTSPRALRRFSMINSVVIRFFVDRTLGSLHCLDAISECRLWSAVLSSRRVTTRHQV